ncbi:hypothetical protein SCANM63S_02988 [Streptomyces canarius]
MVRWSTSTCRARCRPPPRCRRRAGRRPGRGVRGWTRAGRPSDRAGSTGRAAGAHAAVGLGRRGHAGGGGDGEVEPLVTAVELRPGRSQVHLVGQPLQARQGGFVGVAGGQVGESALQHQPLVDERVDLAVLRAVGVHRAPPRPGPAARRPAQSPLRPRRRSRTPSWQSVDRARRTVISPTPSAAAIRSVGGSLFARGEQSQVDGEPDARAHGVQGREPADAVAGALNGRAAAAAGCGSRPSSRPSGAGPPGGEAWRQCSEAGKRIKMSLLINSSP